MVTGALVWLALVVPTLIVGYFGVAIHQLDKRVREALDDLQAETKHAHLVQSQHLGRLVGNHFAASVVKQVATYWDSPEGYLAMNAILDSKPNPDGPTPVALWLTQYARKLREEAW